MTDRGKNQLDQNIATHIFTVSAAMVGVCLTVISLFRISDRLEDVSNMGQAILAIDATAFLASCGLAYTVLRRYKQGSQHRIERAADGLFLSGLALMAIVCAMIAYELI